MEQKGQLDYLWQYQILDLKIDELEKKKKNCAARKELYKSIKYLKNQQESLIKLNENVDKKNHIYNRIYNEIQKISKKLKEEEEKINSGNIKTFKQLDQIEKKLLEMQEELNEKRKELTDLLEEMDSINKKLQGVSQRLRKGKKEYDKIKKEYDLVMKDVNEEYDEIKAQKDSIKEKLDNSLFKKYNAIKGNHKLAIAEIQQDRCGGCNMVLASLVVQNVRDKAGIIECENCGRILYLGSDTQVKENYLTFASRNVIIIVRKTAYYE
ncbi:MAG: C4-type zinc ribbon domain-containing protein [Caldicoprobacterales bacterium]